MDAVPSGIRIQYPKEDREQDFIEFSDDNKKVLKELANETNLSVNELIDTLLAMAIKTEKTTELLHKEEDLPYERIVSRKQAFLQKLEDFKADPIGFLYHLRKNIEEPPMVMDREAFYRSHEENDE